ncbi:methyl-accepting chemotaxis protein [Thalassotalea ganghwensis]
MLIKHKLIANTSILVVALLLMLGLLSYSVSSLQGDTQVARLIGSIESQVLQLRRNEKDFIARKDPKYHDKFESNYQVLLKEVTELQQIFGGLEPQASDLKTMRKVVADYEKSFSMLVEKQKLIGLHPKDGLYGKLRSAVHAVEEQLGDNDYQLLSNMLQLRRNEKDFMLRLDDKYWQKWQDNSANFIEDVKASDLNDQIKTNVITNINIYASAFGELVNAQREFGFASDQGLLGDMRATIHQVDKVLDSLLKSSREAVIAHGNFVHRASYIIFTLVLIISITFAVYMSRSILQGVNKLRLTMNEVSTSKDLSIRVDDSGKDELAEMAKVFNSMITSFRNLIVEVNQSVDTVNIATQNLSANIHKANEGVDSQIQQTDMVATAVTEMVATVNEIASNTHAAADKANTTNQNAIRGKDGVDATISQIDNLSNRLLESEHVVQELAKDSDTIGSVLDVIRGIAEQTNLLALNAAIEAARAGEQGRGFAVVADEVRTLASRTQDSTQEIEGIISSLQSRTKEIVSHMAGCRTQGQESADQAATAGAMLEEITQDVSTIMEMNTAIAAAIQQQSNVASEVNEHVVLIRDVAEEAGRSAEQNSQMSEELAQQADVLNKEVNQFKV